MRQGGRAVDPQQAISDLVGGGAQPGRRHHLLRDAADVLDQDDAQVDRRSPELAERERLAGLMGADVAAELVGVQRAVRVGHVGPHDPEDPGVTLEEARPELRQLVEVPAGEVFAYLSYLLLHRVEVVHQPFCRRGDGPIGLDVVHDRLVAPDQGSVVLLDALEQRHDRG